MSPSALRRRSRAACVIPFFEMKDHYSFGQFHTNIPLPLKV